MSARRASAQSNLVIEDSDEDFSALARILSRNAALPPVRLQRCARAEEALAQLDPAERTEDGAERQKPALIVLDLNLPGLDGRTVLKRVRAHRTWKQVPVVVFSSATHPAVIDRGYANGANAYRVKDMNYPAFKQSVEMFASYWLKSAQLPARETLPPRFPVVPPLSRL
jgi:CheY-like chemotaxis protein